MAFESSDEIKLISEAFVQAQAEFASATKDKENPHFKSSYADLKSCLDAVKEPLSKHGLSILQLARTEGNNAIVKSIILHKSGQFIASELAMPAGRATAQAIGSAITYAKRYGIMAMLGITADDEDDDGNAASEPPGQNGKPNNKSNNNPNGKPNNKPIYDNNKPEHQNKLLEILDNRKLIDPQYYEQIGKALSGKAWENLPDIIKWAKGKIAEKERANAIQSNSEAIQEEVQPTAMEAASNDQNFNPFP